MLLFCLVGSFDFEDCALELPGSLFEDGDLLFYGLAKGRLLDLLERELPQLQELVVVEVFLFCLVLCCGLLLIKVLPFGPDGAADCLCIIPEKVKSRVILPEHVSNYKIE